MSKIDLYNERTSSLGNIVDSNKVDLWDSSTTPATRERRDVSVLKEYIADFMGWVSQATAPTNPSDGDGWYDTGDDELKIYNGTSFVAVGGSNWAIQATAPTSPNEGDGWYDTGDDDALKIWDGSSWVTVGGTATVVDASTTVKGIVELATMAEFNTGTSTTLVPTVRQVSDGLAAQRDILVRWSGLWGEPLTNSEPAATRVGDTAATAWDGSNNRWQLIDRFK